MIDQTGYINVFKSNFLNIKIFSNLKVNFTNILVEDSIL